MTFRACALLLSLAVFLGAAIDDRIKDNMNEDPAALVLVQKSPSLYDPYASDDDDYPQAIPVRRLVRSIYPEKINILKSIISTITPESTQRQDCCTASAPLHLSFYHRQDVLRI